MKLDNILIADDKLCNLDAARQIISSADLVLTAKDAIEKLQEFRYDLVITDMQMENTYSGFDVIRECYNKGTLAYVASEYSSGYHGNHPLARTFETRVRPYGANIETLKNNPQTWEKIMEEIKNPKEISHQMFQEVMLILKGKKLESFDMFKILYDPRG